MLVVTHFSLEESVSRDIFRSSVHCARSLIKPGNGQGLGRLKVEGGGRDEVLFA